MYWIYGWIDVWLDGWLDRRRLSTRRGASFHVGCIPLAGHWNKNGHRRDGYGPTVRLDICHRMVIMSVCWCWCWRLTAHACRQCSHQHNITTKPPNINAFFFFVFEVAVSMFATMDASAENKNATSSLHFSAHIVRTIIVSLGRLFHSVEMPPCRQYSVGRGVPAAVCWRHKMTSFICGRKVLN